MWRDIRARRRGQRSLLAGAVLIACATLGCDGDSTTEPARPLPANIQSFIDAYCDMARACCQSAGFPAEPLADCESEFVRQTDFAPLVEGGTVLVDEAKLSGCVAEIRQAQSTCIAPDWESACQNVFRGTRNQGEPCVDVLECVSQSEPTVCFHLREADGGDASGICRVAPRGALGDPCFYDCGLGENCRSDHSTPLPDTVLTLCHEADGLFCGQGCERLLDNGNPCESTRECGSSSFCDTSCKPRGNLGASCTSNDACSKGFYCLENSCRRTPVAANKLCSGDYD